MLACAPGPLRLAALGGSSTAGHALQRWSPALFHALLARRINDTFPHPAHQHTNAGTPGTGPVYMEKCLRYELPAGDRGGLDLDLVLVEYTQNNQYFADKVSLERLVRRLLALPSSPAVKSFEPSGVKSTWRRDGQAMRALDSLFRYREGAPFSDAHVCESKL